MFDDGIKAISEKIFKIDEDEKTIVFGVEHLDISDNKNDINKKVEDYIREKIPNKTSKDIVILSDPREQIEYVLSKKVIGYIKSHGGDLSLVKVDYEKGEIIVSMSGACSLCPSAVVTMKAGIRRILSQFIPWVKRVEPAEEPKEPNFGFKLSPKSEIKSV